jgi:hypothetical protein
VRTSEFSAAWLLVVLGLAACTSVPRPAGDSTGTLVKMAGIDNLYLSEESVYPNAKVESNGAIVADEGGFTVFYRSHSPGVLISASKGMPYGEMTLTNSWQAKCTREARTEEIQCFIALGFEGPPGTPILRFYDFWGRTICVGRHDFPGRVATVRVDEGKAVPMSQEGKGDCVSDAGATTLLDQLARGKIATITFSQRPSGVPVDAIVDLAAMNSALRVMNWLKSEAIADRYSTAP